MDLSQMQLNSLVLYKMYLSVRGEVSRGTNSTTLLSSWLLEDNFLNKLNLLHRNKWLEKINSTYARRHINISYIERVTS